MNLYILFKFGGFSKRISPKLFWYIGLKFLEIPEIVRLSQFRNFILLASSDTDKPILIWQKYKEGFTYMYRLQFYCKDSSHNN